MANRKIIKKGKIRIRPTLLQDDYDNIKTYEWQDKLPELLIIAGLLESNNAIKVAEIIAPIKEYILDESKKADFRGNVTEICDIAKNIDAKNKIKIKSILQAIFCKENISLLRTLDIPAKKRICDILSISGDFVKGDLHNVMHITDSIYYGKKSGRSIRAKSVQLLLFDSDGSRNCVDISTMNHILTSCDDNILGSPGCANINSCWSAIVCMDDDISEWANQFWKVGNMTQCLLRDPKKGRDRISINKMGKSCISKIDRLWGSILKDRPKHDILFISDIVFGLSNRIWRFMHHIKELSCSGNGEMAEIAARCQWESLIILEWLINKNDPELFFRYRFFSGGKAKALLEKIRDDKDVNWNEYAKKMEATLANEAEENMGVWEQLIAEELGDWVDKSLHGIAEELSKAAICNGLSAIQEYNIFFKRLCDIVHGTWRGLERYHLRKCMNPLHRDHYLPWTGATHDAGISILQFGVEMDMRCIKDVINYLGNTANPKWMSRINTIEKFFYKSITNNVSHCSK